MRFFVSLKNRLCVPAEENNGEETRAEKEPLSLATPRSFLPQDKGEEVGEMRRRASTGAPTFPAAHSLVA